MTRVLLFVLSLLCVVPTEADAQLGLQMSGGVPLGLGPEHARTAFSEQFAVGWGGSYELTPHVDLVASSRFNQFSGKAGRAYSTLRTWSMTAGPRIYFENQRTQAVRPYFTTQVGTIYRQMQVAGVAEEEVALEAGVELTAGVELDVAPRTALFAELNGQTTIGEKVEPLHYGGVHAGFDIRF